MRSLANREYYLHMAKSEEELARSRFLKEFEKEGCLERARCYRAYAAELLIRPEIIWNPIQRYSPLSDTTVCRGPDGWQDYV